MEKNSDYDKEKICVMEQIKYLKPKDLHVIENDNEFILKKGFIHINEIIINKTGSSNEFINTFHSFIREESVILSSEHSVWEDFQQLLRFGFVNIESNQKVLLIAEKDIYDKKANELSKNIDFLDRAQIMRQEDVVLLNENKDPISLDVVYAKYRKIFEDYDSIYYLDDFRNITSLRAINRITKQLNMELTLGIYDNENVYVTKIKHGYTGCFECLEKHIISKFTHKMDYYVNKESIASDYNSSSPAIYFLYSIIFTDIHNVLIYGNSTLLGQIIHFYLPNFEYSYNVNRKYVSCPTCAGINNVMFEEQNVRSINIIKGALLNGSV